MNRYVSMIAGALLAGSLAACGESAPTPEPAATPQMDGMAMATETRSATGTGTIAAIDIANARVTIDHGDIAELDWPPMSMGFEAEPASIEGFNVGDRVDFEFDWDGSKGALTKFVRAQP